MQHHLHSFKPSYDGKNYTDEKCLEPGCDFTLGDVKKAAVEKRPKVRKPKIFLSAYEVGDLLGSTRL